MFTKFNKEEGVTLIELLVITGIISILATGLVLLINPVQKINQARDTQRKSDLAQLQRALEIYYQDNESYPSSTSYIIDGVAWGNSWTPYISRLPKDPASPTQRYVYYSPNPGSGACANNQCYYLYASLQAASSDRQACYPGTTSACANAVAFSLTNRCGGLCNYGVTSANTAP